MQIAPLDHLWVRGSVSELDADKVEVGQKLRVIFPYSDAVIDDEVEYIDKAIDPETRSAKFRASIENPEKRFKAGMFVRVLLRDSPRSKAGRCCPAAPWSRSTASTSSSSRRPARRNTQQFERRNILVSKETSDWVIVAEPSKDHAGLQPGEQVVTNGSLILEQMYEDRLTVEGEISQGPAPRRRGVRQARQASLDHRPLNRSLAGRRHR